MERSLKLLISIFSAILALYPIQGLACSSGCGESLQANADNEGPVLEESPTVIKWKYDKYMTGPPVTLHPERTIWIKISSTDVNRIVCRDGEITDVNFSSEKGVKVKISGSEAYLKLQAVKDQGGTYQYRKDPVDVYVNCAGDTYGFIGRPLAIPSKTIYLVNPAKRLKQASSIMSSGVDRAVSKIMEQAFTDSVPPAWLSEPSRKVSSSLGLKVSPIKTWRIPGAGILVRMLALGGNGTITEKDLLDPGITTNPVAISIEDPHLEPGKAVRAVILEKVYAE